MKINAYKFKKSHGNRQTNLSILIRYHFVKGIVYKPAPYQQKSGLHIEELYMHIQRRKKKDTNNFYNSFVCLN